MARIENEYRELEPCPFCAGEAEIVHQPATPCTFDTYYVCCKRCGVSTVRTARKRHQAAEMWNRRADNGA